MFKKLSLELGGKNPTIIFADCDFDKTVAAALRSAFTNQGQICLCGSRIIVENSIYEKFKTRFVELVRELKIGDPMDAHTNQGALVSQMQFRKVIAAVETAKQEGATILTGGNVVQIEGRCANGWFFEPTVLEGLGPDCKTNKEEIFGPVVSIAPFASLQEALQLANNCEYGLAASVWTSDINKAHRVASELESGIVWINTWLERDLRTPFGGVKNSGVGREGGWEAMRFFTEAKNVCIKYD